MRSPQLHRLPTPLHCTPHSNSFYMQLVQITELACYIFLCFFQGATASGSREGDHNSGPTSTSSNHHDICPFQRSPNQYPSTLLGELAFFWLVITRVLLLQEEREAFSREKERMVSESSSKTVTHALQLVVVYIYLLAMQYS